MFADACSTGVGFMWVGGIQTHILMIVEEAFLPTEIFQNLRWFLISTFISLTYPMIMTITCSVHPFCSLHGTYSPLNGATSNGIALENMFLTADLWRIH